MPILRGFYLKCHNAYIYLIRVTPVGIKPLTPMQHTSDGAACSVYVCVICRSLPFFACPSSASLPHRVTAVCFYSPRSSISPSSPLLSSFLCSSLSIRRHSGLMVGFKLRYKVIRRWMHFWLLCFYNGPGCFFLPFNMNSFNPTARQRQLWFYQWL